MSAYVRREYPQWSWSFSRDQTFQACPRRYYYKYYGSHNGWEYSAGKEAALAYRLKKLSNIYMVLGDAVHQAAEHLAQLVVKGQEVPPGADLEEQVRRVLRQAWRSSRDQRQLFLERPNRVTMLHEFYYGSGPGPEVVERINLRATQASAALATSPTWPELAAFGSELIGVEQFDTFILGDTPVYAVPDLLFRTEQDLWFIIDWKTGEQADENQDQVALYALYVQQKYGVAPEKIRARLEYLNLDLVWEGDFSEEELLAVQEKAEKSMTRMRALLQDPAQNAPKSKSNFPLTTKRGQCGYCNFYELCKGELAQEFPAPGVS